MNRTFKVEEFEGPLELLLKLIEDEKLDITTISLAQVTDQYLRYIQNEEELPSDEVADFLVVAAKLIYLKSKHLLPALEFEEDDGDDLEQQLKIFREYYNASKQINKILGKERFSYVRTTPMKLQRQPGFSPPPNVTAGDFPGIMDGILKKIEQIVKLPKIVLKATVSIREKINMLREAIQSGMMHFHKTYDTGNKSDTIVSFLALLELVKMRHVHAEQDGLFSEIVLRKGSYYE